jgi:hypothetical protein
MLQAVLAVSLVGIACEDAVTPPVTSFEAALLGANMVPAVSSTAGATGTFNLVANDDTLVYSITITAATGTAIQQAHIRAANTGANSNTVAAWLCGNAGTLPTPPGTAQACPAGAVGNTIAGRVAVSDATVTSMRAFGTYVDISTAANPAATAAGNASPNGELRGQLRVVAP